MTLARCVRVAVMRCEHATLPPFLKVLGVRGLFAKSPCEQFAKQQASLATFSLQEGAAKKKFTKRNGVFVGAAHTRDLLEKVDQNLYKG